MSRYDLPEDYSVRLLRQSVRDSLMSHGEEAIILALYHASIDQDTQPRCSLCYDDVYHQPEDQTCTRCWGTTFEGGVKTVARVWALFTDGDTNEEVLSKRGTFNPDTRNVQTEYPPVILSGDYIVRVRRWSRKGHIPVEVEGFYQLGKVDPLSLRTGLRFGQYDWDYVSQTAPVSEVTTSHVITQYPIVGQAFRRLDEEARVQ